MQDVVLVLGYICRLLAERAALLVAVPMATFLDRMNRQAHPQDITTNTYITYPFM